MAGVCRSLLAGQPPPAAGPGLPAAAAGGGGLWLAYAGRCWLASLPRLQVQAGRLLVVVVCGWRMQVAAGWPASPGCRSRPAGCCCWWWWFVAGVCRSLLAGQPPPAAGPGRTAAGGGGLWLAYAGRCWLASLPRLQVQASRLLLLVVVVCGWRMQVAAGWPASPGCRSRPDGCCWWWWW